MVLAKVFFVFQLRTLTLSKELPDSSLIFLESYSENIQPEAKMVVFLKNHVYAMS